MLRQDVLIRWTKGQGPGGQHKNKVANCCVMTHAPSGVTVKVDGRSRRSNESVAWKILAKKLKYLRAADLAANRKADRDVKIRTNERVRTYDYTRNLVTDHRTGKTASIKNIVDKGRLELLR